MEIVEIIQQLHKLRKIPQFLFLDSISPQSMISLRKEILSYKKENPISDEIDFIIHSPGGSPADAYRIIRTLRENFSTVNVIVPFWAKSAATLLSLGATRIIMDEFGEFGPLDIQIGIERDDSPEIDRESALNDEYSVRRIETRSQEMFYQMFVSLYSSEEVKINKNELSKQILHYLSSFYEPLLRQINPYNLGRKKRILDIGEQYANRILLTYNPNLDNNKRKQLIDYLVNRCPDHGYVIDYTIISRFLDNVSKSSEISQEYAEVLQDLTTELIPLEEKRIIGFILAEVEENVNFADEGNKNTNQTVIEEITTSITKNESHVTKNEQKSKSKSNRQKS